MKRVRDPAGVRAELKSRERRGLIRGGLSLGALSLLTGCDLSTQSGVDAALWTMERFNDRVQALLFNPNRLATTYSQADITQPFRFNAFYEDWQVQPVPTGWRLAVRGKPDVDPERNVVVRLFRRLVPTDARYHGDRFTARVGGRRVATLLLVALVAIEATDVVFAIDSVAAILAITTNTFLVWTATAFAVLGLRSLYFCLAGLLRHRPAGLVEIYTHPATADAFPGHAPGYRYREELAALCDPACREFASRAHPGGYADAPTATAVSSPPIFSGITRMT